MAQPSGNRSRVEIVADILRLLRMGDASKVEIIHVSQISAERASRSLEKLVEAGVLEDAEEKMHLPSYRITRKGLALLNLIEKQRETRPVERMDDILRELKITEINLGKILVTGGISKLTQENKYFAAFVQKSLDRYRKGEWGETSSREKRLNALSEEQGHLLFSSYESRDFPEIWITTSPNREYTTIMFPDECASTLPLESYTPARAVKSPE